MTRFATPKPCLLICVFLWVISATADTLTGTVNNHTTGKPAVGDEVVLLRLGEGMQEEARTKTDAKGAFSLDVPSLSGPHLLQVTHQGVKYDQPVSGSGDVAITVYDSVATIPGLSGPMGIAQMESDGKVLKITEMYAITNQSSPPVTQFRPDNFEITVPPKAQLDSAQARRGQGIWLNIKPEPVTGKSGRFSINFPIRPGDTLFKFSYHLPYQGPTTLHLRVPYPIEKFGVMHPPSMSFKALHPSDFRSGAVSSELQGEIAVATPIVGDVPAFQISGAGSAPAHGTESATPPPESTVSAPPAAATPAPAQTAASVAADRPRIELWFVLAGTVVMLALAVFAVWRMKRKPAPAATPQKSLLDALKEELFQLESDRLRGALSAEEYNSTKQALNQSIQRLLKKT